MEELLEKIRREPLKMSSYAHFDKKLSSKTAREYLEKIYKDKDKKIIIAHRFKPFISYFQSRRRYVRAKNKLNGGKVKVKKRLISLPSNEDNLIYKYYSLSLNIHYEEYLNSHSLSLVPTAYRKGIGKSNITSAKEVVDNIVDQNKAWIVRGDFSHFFDNLDHYILKQNLKTVLKTDYLPPDWYRVFKSITDYRFINQKDIPLKMRKIASKTGKYVRSAKELGKLIDNGTFKISRKNVKGIPQGTSLSAVLANVYMCSFDDKWNGVVSKLGGIYRRYSDDFIIVLPGNLSYEDASKLTDEIIEDCFKRVKLRIEKHKTKLEFYDGSKKSISMFNKSGQSKKSALDYLGFNFDGRTVSLRGRSFYKFYYRGKKATYFLNKEKILWIHRKDAGFFVPHGKIAKYYLASTKTSYMLKGRYTHTYQGYAYRAQREFAMNNDDSYKVVIQAQADRAVFKNQRYLHLLREQTGGANR
jgi:hypothetical protein